MRRQKPKRTLSKGGGGGGGGSRITTDSTQKRGRTNTNTADKSQWKLPPGTQVDFYKGKRVHGYIEEDGEVNWSLDGEQDKSAGSIKIPTQELKDLRRAWNEYLKSPNSKQILRASILYEDGAGGTREKMYRSMGFEGKRKGPFTALTLDNR